MRSSARMTGNFNDLAKHETREKEVEEQRRAVHRLMKDFVEMMHSPRCVS